MVNLPIGSECKSIFHHHLSSYFFYLFCIDDVRNEDMNHYSVLTISDNGGHSVMYKGNGNGWNGIRLRYMY